ncbi:hypothetical protein RRG08_031297 [Elysia crispata]|uniref:Uncharacterized protein n=1 Tax=Elysia crispata TaxID=231223 RepID=A0AAE1DZD9_9GAST|nr:hypothetical protein RRG08_031297 [Elysia crispata]
MSYTILKQATHVRANGTGSGLVPQPTPGLRKFFSLHVGFPTQDIFPRHSKTISAVTLTSAVHATAALLSFHLITGCCFFFLKEMSSEYEKGVCGMIVYALIRRKKKSRANARRYWTKQWLLDRNLFTHTNLLNELRAYPSDFHNYLRMDEETYLELLSLVTPLIEREDTVMRAAISPHERLTATLRFLATGRSYEDLKFSTCISPQALGRIVPETCRAICKCLVKDYLKVGLRRPFLRPRSHLLV